MRLWLSAALVLTVAACSSNDTAERAADACWQYRLAQRPFTPVLADYPKAPPTPGMLDSGARVAAERETLADLVHWRRECRDAEIAAYGIYPVRSEKFFQEGEAALQDLLAGRLTYGEYNRLRRRQHLESVAGLGQPGAAGL